MFINKKNHGLLQVKFRLVVFRPFVGEIITARLKESKAEGLRCKLCRMFTVFFSFSFPLLKFVSYTLCHI